MTRIDSLFAKIGKRCLEDLLRQVDSGFVVERQRTNRHTGHTGGIFDHRSRNAFNEHVVGFRHIAQHAAIDVEATCIVDDNRRLLDRTNIVECNCERLLGRLFAQDHFHQHHLVDRREEVNADEVLRTL
ncbi:hypothetical protein D9M70_592050 [compost metagenome]